MQLLKIVVYAADREPRVVDFRPGRLNIVTGESRTGKSAMITIVDYCLGRDTARVPAGPIANAAAWFGTLWEMSDGARAFLGRPAFRVGASSSSSAMLEFGSSSLDIPAFDELRINTDSDSLRAQVSQRIGLSDVVIDPGDFSDRRPFTIGLGTAALFCFQEQDEIASKGLLFHRQSDINIARSLSDSLPFFLGATSGDDASQRARFREAKRVVARLERAIERAREDEQERFETLQALVAEANAVGLTTVRGTDSAETALDILHRIRTERSRTIDDAADIEAQDRQIELEVESASIRSELRGILTERELLLSQTAGEGGYVAAVAQQAGRLSSIDILGIDESDSDQAETCPICGHELVSPDPTASAIHDRVEALSKELEHLAAAQPARQSALARLNSALEGKRQRLRELDAAVDALDRANADRSLVDSREFVRGRIDAIVSGSSDQSESALSVLERDLAVARERVQALDRELDDDAAAARLSGRLAILSRSMTSLAQKLALEHSEIAVRLDVNKLTIFVETEESSVPLNAIGSAANLIGYHLVAHLALHEFFVERDRPVPRVLILDQPTQAYYQSEESKESGKPSDADREAVAAMFKAMLDITQRLSPSLQVIVIDHANLEESWFQDAVEHNWRDGEKLIPESWLDG